MEQPLLHRFRLLEIAIVGMECAATALSLLDGFKADSAEQPLGDGVHVRI
jgi:hypothetical protein